MATRKKTDPAVASTADLRPDESNPRTITDANAAGLRQSITKFGDLSAILFNLKTKQLVTGHQRIEQIRAQWGDCPVQPVDENSGVIRTPGGDFPVRFVRWSKARQRAANVTANNQTIQGRFDETLEAFVLEVAEDLEKESPGLMQDVLLADLLTTSDDGADAVDLPPVFQVIVECKNEEEQRKAFQLLESNQFQCKVLTQ